MASRRLPLVLLGVFSAVAISLAAIGLAAVLAHGVGLRTREIGLRMALGAGRKDVSRQVLGEGLSLALLGVALGAIVSLASTPLLAHLLYGVGTGDPLTIVSVVLLLLAISFAASYGPARRAARISPQAALHHDGEAPAGLFWHLWLYF